MRPPRKILLLAVLVSLVLVPGLARARHKKKPTPTPAPTATPTPAPTPTPSATPTPTPLPVKVKLETYPDLIEKAHNLTLQRDRLQVSQILVHGLSREGKSTNAYRELSHALNELSRVFYTQKAQSLYALGDSLVMQNPPKEKEAIDRWNEALRLEDGNVTILIALARTQLRGGECASAEPNIKQAQTIDPVSGDLKLLQAQLLDCEKHFDELTDVLAQKPTDLGDADRAWTGLLIEDLVRRDQLKKAKTLAQSLEQSATDYPQAFYWRWKLSGTPPTDHAAAQRYVMVCQALTPRKKKLFEGDLALCAEREHVESALKDEADDGK